MSKKFLILILGGLVIVGGIFITLKSKIAKKPPLETDENIVEESQKTLEEMQGINGKISFEKTVNKGEVLEINFRFRDYKNIPQNSSSFKEIQDSLITLPGKASFKIIESGVIDKIDDFHKAHSGKSLLYLLYEFKGDASNPEGDTIHPYSLSETGWDPAPQFVIIIDGKDKYASSYYTRSMLRSKGYEAPLGGIKIAHTEWVTNAAVWEIDQDVIPIVALKYIDLQGGVHYIKVNL